MSLTIAAIRKKYLGGGNVYCGPQSLRWIRAQTNIYQDPALASYTLCYTLWGDPE
jgi:hypothetical protein